MLYIAYHRLNAPEHAGYNVDSPDPAFPFPILERRPDDPVDHFQIFGDKNSGTNLARTLIAKNLTVEDRPIYGWKHSVPAMAAFSPGALVVVLVRNAVDWSTAMYRLPHRNLLEDGSTAYSDFIRREWYSSIGRKPRRNWTKPWNVPTREDFEHRELQLDRHPITGQRYRDIFEMRRVKLTAMLGVRHRGVNMAVVRFEDLRQDPHGFIQGLADRFELSSKREVHAPRQRLSPGRLSGREKSVPQALSASDTAFLLRGLDPDSEALAGYRYDDETAAVTLL